ncbi:hypothetical protein DYBT9275_02822 [Dyadobacter sp. CECT 9275]|uniref:Lipoprotein n=1 Tax=Dyadobacter helix TaxID=2822344 RepID=A0A916JGF0_9BACT|nr:hypothetical protein [Dyadobacter sp. CECT 9275]CAG5002157.1 hypothetical protein DYBT9275_02822 [Dyadobacter sp. CECT 9275]
MKIRSAFKSVRVVVFFIGVSVIGQACTSNESGRYETSSYGVTDSPCESYQQNNFALLNSNIPKMVQMAQRAEAGQDPSAWEIASSLGFLVQISNNEKKIQAECPASFALYEEQRDEILAMHGLGALLEYFVRSNN